MPTAKPKHADRLILADLEHGDQVELMGDNFEAHLTIIGGRSDFPDCIVELRHDDVYVGEEEPVVGQIIGFIHYSCSTRQISRFTATELPVTGGVVVLSHGETAVHSAPFSGFAVRRKGQIIISGGDYSSY